MKKHAGVDRARVALGRTDKFLTICVEDEGQSMAIASLDGHEGTGFGLSRVRERLRQVGGHMEVDSAESRGMRVSIQVPWHSTWTHG